MKPKRRSNLPPRSVTLASHQKRKRYASESTSPVRRKSSGESVRPPPEFIPVNYEQECPTLMKFVKTELDDLKIDEEKDLLNLQYELEALLSECAMNQRRAHGEVQFLTTGEYPKENLKNRPMPIYKIQHYSPPASPTSVLEREGICGLPSDEVEDNLDEYPPPLVTSRFWNWCEHDFLSNLDADFLKNFKELIVDKYDVEELKPLYVNEPWKYRRKGNSSSSRPRTSSGSRSHRKNGVDLEEKEKPNRRSSRDHSNKTEPLNNNKSHLVSLVNAACRTVRKDSKATPDTDPIPARRLSHRLHSREDPDSDKRAPLLVKNEPMEVEEQEDEINGHSYQSPPVLSPRVLKREREDDDYEKMNGFSDHNSEPRKNGYHGSTENGKPVNGAYETPKTSRRRNGEKNGTVTFSEDSKPADEQEKKSPMEDEFSESDAVLIGSKIINKLVAGGFLPHTATHIFEEMSKNDVDQPSTSKVEFDEEGKDDAEDQSVDDLSNELLRCQLELSEFEPSVHAMIGMVWRRAKAQFSYWETFEQLKSAEYDLFRLGVNTYRDNPRKLPTNNEKPVLKQALVERARKARFHYGKHYRRLKKYRCKPQQKKKTTVP